MPHPAVNINVTVLPSKAGAEDGKQLKVAVEIDAVNPVCSIKRAVEKEVGIPAVQQRLQLAAGVDQFSFPADIEVTRRAKRNPTSDLVVMTMNTREKSYAVKVDPNDTVLDVKFLLANELNVQPEVQVLYFQPEGVPDRAPLPDGVTLKKAGIKSGATLRVMFVYPSTEEGHGDIHRGAPQLMEYADPALRTVCANFRNSVKLYGKKPFLGTRSYLPNGERGPYEWKTYEEVGKQVDCAAQGLKQIGAAKGDSIGIMAVNREEWVVTDIACAVQTFLSVPLYDTLGPEAAQFITNHAGIKIIVSSVKNLQQISNIRKDTPTVEHVIVMDATSADQAWVQKNRDSGLFTMTFTELLELGRKNIANYQDNEPTPDDLITLCYTSGTTGNPKGAMLTHANVIATSAALNSRMPENEEGLFECALSYLPLAHIYERSVQAGIITRGHGVGFFQGDTTKLLDDLAALKPTMFPGVPRVYQRMFDKIKLQVDESNFIRRFLFNKALDSRVGQLHRGDGGTSIWDSIVFKKVAANFGGNIRIATSGAAPLSPKIAEFMRIALVSNFVEGYGLTETCAAATTTDLDETTYGTVGSPVGCVEIKLVDVPDMEYLTSDKPNARGEIWIRGPNIFKGYYKQEDKTAETMEGDWFKTGDIGTWLPTGALKIIDRKKNIFKLSQGEYIRPEYIENVYKMSKYIANAFVHGTSTESHLVAVIVPDFEILENWAADNGLSGKSHTELLAEPKVKALLGEDMLKIAKTEKLRGFEVVKRFELEAEDFSPENGLLTPTFKLKRFICAKHYKEQIDAMYASIHEEIASKPAKAKL